jgi:hypothetical protein
MLKKKKSNWHRSILTLDLLRDERLALGLFPLITETKRHAHFLVNKTQNLNYVIQGHILFITTLVRRGELVDIPNPLDYS